MLVKRDTAAGSAAVAVGARIPWSDGSTALVLPTAGTWLVSFNGAFTRSSGTAAPRVTLKIGTDTLALFQYTGYVGTITVGSAAVVAQVAAGAEVYLQLAGGATTTQLAIEALLGFNELRAQRIG
jgi:hypothetical protein